jgi:RNA polymerase sigma factor (sigma-70 family)
MSASILKLLAAAPVAALSRDAELVARFVRARDEAAFAELVRRHGPLVYRVCSRLVGPDLADDAFQAVFLVLACRADRLQKPGSVGSWLVGVAGRVARQLRIREARRAAGELPEVADHSRAPEQCVLGTELARLLDDELTRLPDHLRDAVVLCLLQGRTQDEAAAELGGSVRTLRRRLDRAKAILRLRLERRGVLPAVAAGLVSGGMAGARSVPPELTCATVAGVGEFLAGSAARAAPAVIAKGVVAGMGTTKHWLTTACVAALGLGFVWAAAAQTGSQPGVTPPGTGRGEPMSRQPQGPWREVKFDNALPPASQRTANFVVYAPTPVVARVVAGEAEFQREEIAKLWLGKALPKWDKPATIVVTYGWGGGTGSSTLTFADAKTGPRVTDIRMMLDGFTIDTLESALPREVAHTALATHFGRPVPRWADAGIARLHESEATQAGYDTLARQILKEGRGVRLKALFRMTEYPRDPTLLHAQGHSVVRYLLSMGQSHAAVLEFVGTGMKGNTAESWDKAANEFGYRSVDTLEQGWLDWMQRPESQLKADRAGPAKPKEDKSDLIPPVKLPGGTQPIGP